MRTHGGHDSYEDLFSINLMRSMKIPVAVTGGTWNVIDSVLTCDKWGGFNCPSWRSSRLSLFHISKEN